jgi:hypothetical protein
MLVKPEEVGLSSQRLARLGTHMQRYIDAGKVTGTLTLVARHGQIAYCEPQRPMPGWGLAWGSRSCSIQPARKSWVRRANTPGAVLPVRRFGSIRMKISLSSS